MTRLLIIILLMIGGAGTVSAQSGLAIDKFINGGYSSDTKVTATYMTAPNKFLSSHKLNVFASFKGPSATYASEVERMVLSDGSSAAAKNVRYKNGKLYFAFYMLKPVVIENNRINRYIYYLNSAANKGSDVLLVYLEGRAGERDVTELIKNMAQKAK